jgi:LmbE family N-acetylglucosaminyl deacetylase
MKQWIYLSPHFDDVALSAGGLIWEQTHGGDQAEIWTICAGDPPSDRPLSDYAGLMHYCWQVEEDVPYRRSLEDAASCQRVGAAYRRDTIPDNIYRYFPGTNEAVVKVPDDNAGPLEPREAYLIPCVADFLRKNLPEDCELVIPLAIGHHRDHVLTRQAAERLKIPLWHYIDYPYIIQAEYSLKDWIPTQAEKVTLPITPQGLKAWQEAIACHRSQMILYWVDEEEMKQQIEKYAGTGFGYTLWRF